MVKLLLDVGNTQTEVGIFDDSGKLESWRFSSKLFSTEDEIASLLRNFLKFKNIEFSDISDVAVSSVVPEFSYIIGRFGQKYFNVEPLMVSAELDLPITIAYNSPANVGADRICGSVAAYESHKHAVIVLDFGTATTFDVVDGRGTYRGGIITLGLEGTINTLHRNASKLPKVNYELPEKVIGDSTERSIQSGVFYGNIHLVNGLLRDIQAELAEESVAIVATGGLAPLIAPHLEANPVLRTDLILEGLHSILLRNR